MVKPDTFYGRIFMCSDKTLSSLRDIPVDFDIWHKGHFHALRTNVPNHLVDPKLPILFKGATLKI